VTPSVAAPGDDTNRSDATLCSRAYIITFIFVYIMCDSTINKYVFER